MSCPAIGWLDITYAGMNVINNNVEWRGDEPVAYNTTLEIVCSDPSTGLCGSRSITCEADGEWTNYLPMCSES